MSGRVCKCVCWRVGVWVWVLACLRSRRRDASRMAVHGAPSSRSNLISLSAHSSPAILCVREWETK